MEFIAPLLQALSPATLLYITIGVFLGITVGAIPGLTGSMLIALSLPFTFTMEAVNAISMVVLTSTFTDGMPLDATALTGILPQVFLNALFAAPVAAVTERVTLLMSDDDAARRMVASANPMPPVPSEMSGESFAFRLPVGFELH